MQPFLGRGLFFLLRHGTTDWNVEQRVMGRRPVPLNRQGRDEVGALIPYLTSLGIERIWTSPLERARRSAEIVAEALRVPMDADDDLTEVDFGAWEGMTFAEVLEDSRYRDFQADPAHATIPGGESLAMVRDRVYRGMRRIAERNEGGTALVVSHGDPVRLVLAGCLGIDLAEVRRLRVDNGALSAVELTGDWAEVKLMNMRPDLAAILRGRAAAPVRQRR